MIQVINEYASKWILDAAGRIKPAGSVLVAALVSLALTWDPHEISIAGKLTTLFCVLLLELAFTRSSLFAGIVRVLLVSFLIRFNPSLAFQALIITGYLGSVLANYPGPERRIFVQAGLLFSIHQLAMETSWLQYEISSLCWWLSSGLTGLGGASELLGPSVIKWNLIAWGLCLIAAGWIESAGKKSVPAAMATILYLAMVSFSIVLREPLLIVLGLLVVCAVFSRSLKVEDATSATLSRNRKLVLISIICLQCLILIGLVPRGNGSKLEKSLTFLDGGLKTFDVKGEDDFSQPENASFGLFEKLLQQNGWQVSRANADQLKEALEQTSVLVVINPTEIIPSSTKESIYEFLRSGGRMLVLGDHTDIAGVMDPLNDLLGGTDISFRFDSAMPGDPNSRWHDCLHGAAGTQFWNIDYSDLGISIGASLKANGSSRVLVTGTKGYLDYGRPDFGISKLGDMQYSPGEYNGDFALVASQRIGQGEVQVWGDTTGFQDGLITTTGGFMLTNLEMLISKKNELGFRLVSVVCYVVLGMVGIFVGQANLIWLWFMAAIPVCGWFLTSSANTPAPLEPNVNSQVVWDSSHKNVYPQLPFEKSLSKLSDTVSRTGRMLFVRDQFQQTLDEKPDSWIICAPQKPYSRKEVAALKEYVKSGGSLIVSCGYLESDNVKELLGSFDLKITDTVVGAAHNSRLRKSDWSDYVLGKIGLDSGLKEFMNARGRQEVFDPDIIMQESFGIEFDGADLLVDCWDIPIAVEKEIGDGKITLIGDSRFLLNENLGTVRTLNETNARFIIKCLGPK